MDIRVIEIVNSLLLSLSLQTAESQDLRNLFATAGFVTLVRHRGTGVQARARHDYHCESVATSQVPWPVSVENYRSSLAGHGSESRHWPVPLVTVV